MVQACHAAIELTSAKLPPDSESPHLVVCGVKTEQEMNAIMQRLYDSGIYYQGYREPDMDHSLTAIATEPLQGDRRKLMKRYQLLK